MAHTGERIGILDAHGDDDIVRDHQRVGQERAFNGGRAVEQDVVVGFERGLVERLPEAEKALDGIGERAYRGVNVQIRGDEFEALVFGGHGRRREGEPGEEVGHGARLLVGRDGAEGERGVSLRIAVHDEYAPFAFSEAIRYVDGACGLAHAAFVVRKSDDFRCHETLRFASDVMDFLHDSPKKSMIIPDKCG